ncbi:MAG: hypothetical protein JWM78_547 [Verrucomicrobiaceae bacterium]|nr:hypothetical protein [Verrucomicrobiaceae bacterium]
MPLYRTQSVSAEKLLTISINLLHQAFGDTTRLLAKRRFQYLENGKSVYLAHVKMEDDSQLKVNVKLERSELKGKLNFSAFRQVVAHLLGACAQQIESKQQLNTFSDTDEKRWIYLIPALYQSDVAQNMLVLGVNLRQPGELTLELMFVDPTQFQQQERTAAQA